MRALLNELRTRCAEVHTALKELDELPGEAGWRPASDTMGVKTEWKVADRVRARVRVRVRVRDGVRVRV